MLLLHLISLYGDSMEQKKQEENKIILKLKI